MVNLARDPVINAINNGIRRGIEVTVANGCYGSAVVLVYSGMDSMAFLAMPKGQTDVTGKDFIELVIPRSLLRGSPLLPRSLRN